MRILIFIPAKLCELKVVILHIWHVNVKTIGGFINILLADLSFINLHLNNITRL
jgi:hypothetical protein